MRMVSMIKRFGDSPAMTFGHRINKRSFME